MSTMIGVKVLIVVLAVSFCIGGSWVDAQVHHVVGADRGWDPANPGLASWSSGKRFMVGDQIWFVYSAAHGMIAEVRSKEEFDSCDVSNPIRMLTDGLDSISMDQEGTHYFASGNIESCKNGLKLHVVVLSHQGRVTSKTSASAAAQGPAAPSLGPTGATSG